MYRGTIMGKLFDRFDSEPIKGADICIGDFFPEIFVSDIDEIFCYSGVCLSNDSSRTREFLVQPYYIMGKHSTDDSISNQISGFYRIMEGCVVIDNYLDTSFYSRHYYKKLDVNIRFPYSGSYYAVLKNGTEHPLLTRTIFGLTYDELTSLSDAYAKVMGTHNDIYTYPKIIKSNKRRAYCDITEQWIPEQFPYLTFSDRGYDFSHVSLFGFYRHIQLLTGCQINSLFSQSLLKNGLNDKVLRRVFNIWKDIYHQTKVTKQTQI